jgi:hypothetical protein
VAGAEKYDVVGIELLDNVSFGITVDGMTGFMKFSADKMVMTDNNKK